MVIGASNQKGFLLLGGACINSVEDTCGIFFSDYCKFCGSLFFFSISSWDKEEIGENVVV